ncbi:MAG TPA: imidazole glycerol phosphate synthase subunit HisH [Nitrososphaeraceae archaeon]|jgi:glutamine amidotransferase
MSKIAILDYGAGNLFNLRQSVVRNGCETVSIVDTLVGLSNFDGLILPGVGNFDSAIQTIRKDSRFFMNAIDNGMPVLGICLGLEMLFDYSEEGTLDGLSVFPGEVLLLPRKQVKVPHMGWNTLEPIKESKLLSGINHGDWVYYVHSYHINPINKSIVVATSEYGDILPVAIEKENIFGTQFHPEKSGVVGSKIIKNFLTICGSKR